MEEVTNPRIRENPERQARRQAYRLRKCLQCLPLMRERLTNFHKFRLFQRYREASRGQQILTFMYTVYWLLNSVLGLYIID